jgi:hypothetical protein
VLILIIYSAILGVCGILNPMHTGVWKHLPHSMVLDIEHSLSSLPLSLKIFSGIIGGIAGGVLTDDIMGRSMINNQIPGIELVIVGLASVTSGRICTKAVSLIHKAI